MSLKHDELKLEGFEYKPEVDESQFPVKYSTDIQRA